MTYRFGPFVADRISYRVVQDDRVLELTPKLLDLLFYFLERPGTLITKEALLEALWPGANVTDNALAQAISELRGVLGDEPSSPKFIRTVARRGYRFVSGVEDTTQIATPASPLQTATPSGGPGDGASSAPAIAVLDFANVRSDPEVAWLAAGIAETVSSDFAALGHFRVVDRWRVLDAQRHTDGSLRQLASALGVTRLVTGSYQRSGSQLRVTARVVDLTTGEAIADAKVDGPVEDVFSIQDRIVAEFARELGVRAVATAGRLGVRETSSLTAYREFIEGSLKIESLDTAQVNASIAHFERAIGIDPRYAIAYTGLANAECVAYEMTRLAREPNRAALASGIDHARYALQLDPGLAEAHGTLSFLLTSAATFDEARAAALRAVAIEPENWRHHYRLGHASWGGARLRAFERVLALYPQFGYASFEMAMAHVARGHFDTAEEIVRQGGSGQDRQYRASDRFPAIGFHWLLGLLRWALGDREAAADEFERELAQTTPWRMYGPEYAAATLVARGQLELDAGAADRAVASFTHALRQVEDLPHAWLGMAASLVRLGDAPAARTARAHAQRGIDAFRRTNRTHEALLLSACDAALHEGTDAACRWLEQLLEASPPIAAGWTIPIEPFLRPLHDSREFRHVLTRLADRAR